MDVHKEAIAVASGAQDHGAEGVSLGPIGTRQGAMATRRRPLQSQGPPRVCVYAAGPCGSWLSRARTPQGDGCWGVAPAWRPTKPGNRVTTDRRDARPWARLLRSGDLTPGSGPAVDAAALRALRRARDETRRDLQAATVRRNAFVLRHALRSTGRAPGSPAHLRWRRAVGCPPPAPPMVVQAEVQTVTAQTARVPRRAHARRDQGHPGRFPPGVEALQA